MVSSTRATLHVTSTFLVRFWERFDQARENPNMSQKITKIEGHALGLFQDRAPNATRCLLGPWEVIEKESCGLE